MDVCFADLGSYRLLLLLFLCSQITAIDPDGASSSVLEYSIVTDTNGTNAIRYFLIDMETGLITVNSSLLGLGKRFCNCVWFSKPTCLIGLQMRCIRGNRLQHRHLTADCVMDNEVLYCDLA